MEVVLDVTNVWRFKIQDNTIQEPEQHGADHDPLQLEVVRST